MPLVSPVLRGLTPLLVLTPHLHPGTIPCAALAVPTPDLAMIPIHALPLMTIVITVILGLLLRIAIFHTLIVALVRSAVIVTMAVIATIVVIAVIAVIVATVVIVVINVIITIPKATIPPPTHPVVDPPTPDPIAMNIAAVHPAPTFVVSHFLLPQTPLRPTRETPTS